MCLILFAYKVDPQRPLILAANRDEFYDRPTLNAAFWKDSPGILAGRDLKAGGTWMGITRRGRFAALTNYHDPTGNDPSAPSRGAIVANYLIGQESTESYIETLVKSAVPYNKYSIILGSVDDMYYFSNVNDIYGQIESGIHGLCNHLLDTSWPRVVKGKREMEKLLKKEQRPDIEDLLHLLADQMPAQDDALQVIELGKEIEDVLSPIFIHSPYYGTRSSTILLVDAAGKVTFVEKNHQIDGSKESQKYYEFRLEP